MFAENFQTVGTGFITCPAQLSIDNVDNQITFDNAASPPPLKKGGDFKLGCSHSITAFSS